MIEYRQGNTFVYADEEKIVVKNPTGKRHVEANVDQIFGVGEYQKLLEAKYTEEIYKTKGPNPIAKTYELVSGYIPQRVLDELKFENTDYGEYFTDVTK